MKKIKENKLLVSLFILIIYLVFILYLSSTSLEIGNFICYFIFLFILLFIYRDDLKENLKEYKKDKKRIGTILIYFLIVFALSSIVRNVIVNIYINFTGSTQLIDSSNTAIYSLFDKVPWGTLFVCFLTIFFYPIVEELVFRKAIGDSMNKIPTIIFIIISSLLSWYFQVTLLNPAMSEFMLAIGVLLNSIFAAIIYSKKKNILYTIFPRMLYNLLICFIQFIYLFVK